MKRFNYFILYLMLLISCVEKEHNNNNQPSIVNLSATITKKLNSVEGDFAVAFKDLRSGDTLFINASESFHAASTMKTPVMIELFYQADAGHFALDDSIMVKTVFKSIVDGSLYEMNIDDDSDSSLYNKVGQQLSIRKLMYEMITRSSNLATNLLIELVDAKNVTTSMRLLGAEKIMVLRGVEDIKAFDEGLNNTTTAKDLLVILEAIANCTIVSKEACDEMINILLDQEFNEIIPARLPDSVRVAHKTGSIVGVQHDSAIIILPSDSKYVLVLLSKNIKDRKKTVSLMTDISKLIYDHVVNIH